MALNIKDELAARLLAIGRKAADRMSPETKELDHGALLYDDRGLPPDRRYVLDK